MAQLAAQGQRSGKYRHIYGEAQKPEECFQEIKNPLTSGESRYVSANDKFLAVSRASGGGPVYILKLDAVGRVAANQETLSVQNGKALDHDFHPFISNMIATASEDCSVCVSTFPMAGITKKIDKPEVKLSGKDGHQKKVVLCQFNPSANSILASGSFDKTVKVWNIEKAQCLYTFTEMKDNVYSMEWNYDGSQLAITSKDKKLRLVDPRVSDEATCTDSFDGAKSSKCFWLPNLSWVGATGFSKQAKRQLKLWDLKKLAKPIFSTDLDQVSSILMPYYDNDIGVLFLAGKGDSTVSWAEVINDNKKYYPLGQYRDSTPQKGGGWIAKRACDVWKCEIARFLKLTSKDIIPIRIYVPRKAGKDVFQEDIFPDCFAGKPALTDVEWEGGQNKDPILMSMNPANRKDDDSQATKFTKKKTYAELLEENKKLRKENAELKKKLGIKDEEKKDDSDEQKKNDEQKEDKDE